MHNYGSKKEIKTNHHGWKVKKVESKYSPENKALLQINVSELNLAIDSPWNESLPRNSKNAPNLFVGSMSNTDKEIKDW